MRDDLVDQLERLVDGELSDTEQVALLKDLDSHRDAWRWLATRLLEEQLWRGATQQAGAEGIADRPVSDLAVSQLGGHSVAPTLPAAAQSPNHRFTALTMASAAVLLVSLGFSIGSLVTSRGPQPASVADLDRHRLSEEAQATELAAQRPEKLPAENLLAGIQPAATQPVELGAAEPAVWGPVGEFRFVDHPGGPSEFGLPLFAVERLTPEMLYGDAQQWQAIEQWQERFRAMGQRLLVEPAVLAGVLEDGSQLVIPTWQFQLLPETL